MTEKELLKVVNEKTAADMLGMSVHTLQNHRYLGQPPVYMRIGRSIRYRVADIQAYLDECRVMPRGAEEPLWFEWER